MSKISRKIERSIARRKGKEIQGGADAIRRLISGADGLQSISEAISLLKDVGPALEECRDAAVIAVQHAISLERELERERFVRQEAVRALTRALTRALPVSVDIDRVVADASIVWDRANPAPPPEGGPTPPPEGEHVAGAL